MPTTKVEWALHFARLGFPVFPVVENTKRARITAWPALATTAEQQILAWWQEWPNDNIGFCTQDFVVIDIDEGKGGYPAFDNLLIVEDFPKTRRHATQGGGAHVIYASPTGPVKGGNDKLGRGIDVKARGGYILLPGSTIDGRAYTEANSQPVSAAPAWLIERCKQSKPRNDAAGKRIIEEDDLARELFERWMLDHAPTAETGNIDNTTYKVAATGYDYGCSQPTVLDIMIEWNETHCFPPQDIEDLERVVESAGKNRENAIGVRHPLAPGFEPVEIAERPAPDLGMPTSKPKADGMQLEGYFDAAAKALSSQAEPLIKGILDRAAMSILYGESNTGKTFVAVDMAFHVAASMAWAGKKTRHGAIVYVAAEGGVGVYKRLAALRKHYPDVPDVPFFIIKFPVDLLHGPEHGKALVDLCRQAAERSGQPLEMIVIDTLSRAMSGGDENSSTDMGAMVKSFDAIREVTGAHLMVIHHSGKDRARGARGHSLLRAATDTEIEIERGNVHRITVTKQRDMDGEFKQAFCLKTINIGLDADGAHVTSCVVELVKGGTAGPVVVPPTDDESRLAAQLQDRLKRLGEMSFGAQFVRETYLELAWSRGESDPAIYKVLQTLQAKGLVTKMQPGQYVMAVTPKLQTTPN